MVANRNTQISKAVVKLREMSADEKARDMYERQEKARRDHEWAMDYAREVGIEEGRQKGIKELIESTKLSGMSEAEIERILSFKCGG
ncbi:MAG: hypothetical protein FWG90_13875 [Oscillospiraceae bacterium]|nr:hypothetical protein [Oscillospiraceae bacterium]